MRIGFDVDGVLASFNDGFIKVLVETSGRNLFLEGYVPHTWHYAKAMGYTKVEEDAAWDAVHANPTFWQDLAPLAGVEEFNAADGLFFPDVDIYFITKRDSPTAKDQTELWMEEHLDLMSPTVLVTGEKGLACKILNLEVYIDDKVENAQAVLKESPQTRMYLLDRPWNRYALDAGWERVYSVEGMLVLERLTGALIHG